MRNIFYSLLLISFSSQANNWFPLTVDVWTPPFNEDLQRQEQSFTPLKKAEKPWKICAAIPHLKDAYWLAVNFSLVDEAKRLGLRMRIKEAGGYGRLQVQRKQIIDCMDSGADALLLSSVNNEGLSDLVDRYTEQGRPVIDMINWVNAKNITGRAAATYWDNGNLAGEYLVKRLEGAPANILWLPGPKGVGWSIAANRGFNDAIEDSNIKVLETLWGDTGREIQAKLLNQAMKRHSKIDYIVGAAVAIEAALSITTRQGRSGSTEFISFYYGPGVHRTIARGKVLAAVTDKQVLQTKIAVDMAVRALEKKLINKHIAPKVEVVTQSNIRVFDRNTSLPPKGFRPVFSVNDWIRGE